MVWGGVGGGGHLLLMRVGGETTLVSHQQGVQCELPSTQDRNRQTVCTISDCYKWEKNDT